jgi:hypothetical protein
MAPALLAGAALTARQNRVGHYERSVAFATPDEFMTYCHSLGNGRPAVADGTQICPADTGSEHRNDIFAFRWLRRRDIGPAHAACSRINERLHAALSATAGLGGVRDARLG